jgi:hypothetical protein
LYVGGTFMVITLVALEEAKKVAGRDARVLIAAMTSAFAAGQIVGPLTVCPARNACLPVRRWRRFRANSPSRFYPPRAGLEPEQEMIT